MKISQCKIFWFFVEKTCFFDTLLFYSVSKEIQDISKKQLEDLEIRLSNSKKQEREVRDEIEMLKKDMQKSLEDVKIVS